MGASHPTLRPVNADWLRALMRTAAVTPASTRLLSDVVDEIAASHPDRPALLGEPGGAREGTATNGVSTDGLAMTADLTYGTLAAFSNRVARWALARGLAPGDRVALMMANEPAYVAIWLGLTRVGVVVALLDPGLVDDGLRHCLALAAPTCVIVGGELTSALAATLTADATATAILVHGGGAAPHPRLEQALDAHSGAPLGTGERPRLTLRNEALLIYTSGTTGLPKAARVSHLRVMLWSQWFAGITDARPADRLYNCLPMHHSIGGVAAIGAMLAAGGAVIVRRSFSARRFWPDVAATGATLFPYIGELCRYLLAAPPAADTAHSLRLCFGNGLRADVWRAFEARFAIPRIIEFYAATEGSFSLFNLEGKPGAIGRVPSFMAHRSPVALVCFDPMAELPVRGPDGFCQRCGHGEAGEALGRLDAGAEGRFEGYTDAAESERKVLRDVFAPGDAWFRTGDLMKRDAAGFFSFVDRVGDSYRWHGENVSTDAVADAVRNCPGVAAALVYGVAVPGTEGRAGMAAAVVGEGFDLLALHTHLRATLPRHARPLFLRLVDDLAVTATFKPRKAQLVADGFDPSRVTGLLYRDAGDEAYVALDAVSYAAIVAGDLRV